MNDVALPLRFTRGWMCFPRWRLRVVLRWPVHATRRNASTNDVVLLFRYTRRWIHYGLFAHIAICTLVGAVEGVFGR